MTAKHCLFFLLTLAFLFQESVGGANFVLLLILSWLAIRPAKEVFGAAFLAGLLLDLFSNAPFGTHSSVLLLFSFLANLICRKTALVSTSIFLLPLAFLFSGFYQTFVGLFWWRKMVFVFDVRQAVINTFLMIPVIKILFWLKERVITEDSIQLKFGL